MESWLGKLKESVKNKKIMEENKKELEERTGKEFKNEHVINYLETRHSFSRF